MARILAVLLLLWHAAPPLGAQRAARSDGGDSLPVGSFLNSCGSWRLPAPTRGDSVLVDVFFGSVVPLRRGAVGPRRSDIAALSAIGGRVVRRYPFRAVRALIPAGRLTGFSGRPAQFLSVPDPRQHNWEIFLIYRRKLRAADTAEWRALGGRVKNVYDDIGTIFGVLPDTAIRALSERHWLRAIEANISGCVSGPGPVHLPPNVALQPTARTASGCAPESPPTHSSGVSLGEMKRRG